MFSYFISILLFQAFHNANWCHARRKFISAEKTHPAEAQFFIHQIRLLFDLETRIQNLSNEEKFLIRQSESKIILNAGIV
jgi:hypothetical protein